MHANSFNVFVLQPIKFLSLKSQCFPWLRPGYVPRDQSLSHNSCTLGSHLKTVGSLSFCYVTFLGKKWLQGKLYVGRHAAPFKIIFEAERSYNVFGDIAIDDISFVNCTLPPVVSNCKRGQHRCSRGSCIDPSRLCDYTDDCGDNSDELNCYSYNYR